MVGSEFIRTASDTNFDINNRAASGITNRLYQIRSQALLLLDMTAAAGSNSTMTKELRNIFFERNPNIVEVIIPGRQDIINQPFFSANEISTDTVDAWLTKETAALDRAKVGVPVLKNVSPVLGINILALFYPWQDAGVAEAVVVLFSPENLSEIAGTGSSFTMVINGDGDILVHPDFNQVLTGVNIVDNPLVQALRKSSGDSVRLNYSQGGSRFVGAGQQISFADAAVLSSKDYSLITEQIVAVSRRNILLSITVMFLTILVTWLFSRSISAAIKNLTAAAARIESGEFGLDLKPKSRDELGILTEGFNRMGKGLRQREETEKLVGRYNSRELTEKSIAGTLNLNGEFVRAVVLSVDFSSFPDNSKNLDAPEALELLNFFISKTAEIAERHGGMAEKTLGNRMIALWGVPSSSGDNAGDVTQSLNSVLAMRQFLWDLNTEREAQGKIPLRMSCGIHTGDILAGRVGTSAFHEYSFSGETIDDAISAGQTALPAETDIVITEAVRELAGSRFLAEEINVSLPGKSDLRCFALVNLAAEDQGKQRWPSTLNDVRESLRVRPALKTEPTE